MMANERHVSGGDINGHDRHFIDHLRRSERLHLVVRNTRRIKVLIDFVDSPAPQREPTMFQALLNKKRFVERHVSDHAGVQF